MSKVFYKPVTLLLIVLLIVVTPLSIVMPKVVSSQSGVSGVSIIWGPTPIMEGEAKGPNDLTIMNEYYAVAFAISTTPPWGITKGHIIDLAPIGGAYNMTDVIAQFSFPLNDWGNWATIDVDKDFKVIRESPNRVLVNAIGKWKDLLVNYTYIFESGKPYLTVIVNVTNTGSSTYSNLIMGPAITFEVGWTFVPGYGTGRISTGPKSDNGIVEDWVAGYHESFAVGLYAPNYTHISLSTSFVDPFYQVTLEPGQSRVFTAYVMVFNTSDICRIYELVTQLRGGALATVNGNVYSTDGKPIASGITVFEKGGKPYCWSIVSNGSYQARVPAGNYMVYAVARGYSPSSRKETTLQANTVLNLSFTDLSPPGKVVIRVYRNDTGKLTDAVILVSTNYTPPAMYLAITTIYTDPVNIGVATAELAPGNYTLSIGWAPGFLSKWKTINFQLSSGEVEEYNVTIDVLFKPSNYGWYMVDLHHHSNYMDGRTPPDYLVVAQSGFGLDYIFVSDHDYTGNCPVIKQYADARGLPFICGVEISPDWAHFNAYPITDPSKLVYRGTLKDILTAARAAGALVIRANHPYIGGLFIAQEQNNIPGGYYEGWDVAEINGPWGSDDNMTLTKMMTLWNMGIKKYLTGGSDVHDVWATPRSGYPRVVAYLPGGPTIEGLARAELTGKTFITYGPFVFTDPLPGTTIAVKNLSENISVNAYLFAVEGLSRLEVWSLGRLVYTVKLNGTSSQVAIGLNARDLVDEKRGLGWLILIVYDARGNRAITNPIWIDMNTKPIEITTITTLPPVTMTETSTITSTTTVTTTTSSYIYTTVTSTRSVTTSVTTTIQETTPVIAAGIVALIIGIALGALLFRRK